MTRRPVLTSESHPLRIEAVAAPGGGGIGMTFCPGKHQSDGMTAHWQRDLALDLDRIRDWGAVAVVTLMEQHELDRYRVPGLGAAVAARGMAWLHLSIVDVDIPRAPFETAWVTAGPQLRGWLGEGRRILLHCKGGLGRTGTIAARLLIELGMQPEAAIQAVRAARDGTIETPGQLAHVRGLRPPGG
jgi:ADP-ribosyl-[dinitrogen reductase] hydrolase